MTLESPLKHVVLHSLKWMAIARLVAQLLRWTSTILVIRVLSPADFGIAGLAETVIGLLEIFTTMGLGSVIIRSRTLTHQDLRSIFSLLVLINTGLFLLLFLGAPAMAEFYQQPALNSVVKVLSVGFLISAVESVPASLLVKDLKFKQLALIHLLAGLVGATTSLTLAYSGYGYWALVLGGMSIQLARLVGVLVIKPVFLAPSFQLRPAVRFLSFSIFITGSTILWYLYVTLDLVIAGRFWEPETLGVYVVALHLAAMPLNKMMPSLKQVALPAFSKTQEDPEKSRYYLIKSLRMCLGMGLPVFFGLAAVSPLLVPLIFDTKFAAATAPLTMLFMVMPFRMFLELHQPAIIAAGNPRLIFRNSLAILAIMVPAFFFGAQYEPAVLAAVWLALFPALAMASSYFYCRFLGIEYWKLAGNIAPAFLASLIMFIGVRMFIMLVTEEVGLIAGLISSVATGILVYGLALMLLDRKMLVEYLLMFRK